MLAADSATPVAAEQSETTPSPSSVSEAEATDSFESVLNDDAPAVQLQPEEETPPLTSTDTDATVEIAERQINEATYNTEELADVNNITVSIPDVQTPIVVFFGSKSSGKTLTLLRMIRFLEQHDHQVVPEAVFRPQSDRHYARMCNDLKTMAYNQYAPGGTDIVNFMLVKVLDSIGNPRCQILEAPGEHYFDGTATLQFPTYINAIRTSPNRKVWVFFVEQDWGENQTSRDLYAQKICQMQGLISPRDKIVFLINKVDCHRNQYLPNGRPNRKVFFNTIRQQYPNIFSKYQRTGLSKILFGEYNFQLVCFSSGVFTKTNDGREVWTLEDDAYCMDLWKALMK